MPKASAVDMETENRIIELHAEHLTWRQIGQQVGLSHEYCRQIYMAVRDRIPAERLSDLRQDHHELAYRAIADLLTIAENKNVSPRTRAEAWGQIRGWSESDRKLHGVDAPTRREITVVPSDVIEANIVELNAEMARLDAQAKAAGIEIPEFA